MIRWVAGAALLAACSWRLPDAAPYDAPVEVATPDVARDTAPADLAPESATDAATDAPTPDAETIDDAPGDAPDVAEDTTAPKKDAGDDASDVADAPPETSLDAGGDDAAADVLDAAADHATDIVDVAIESGRDAADASVDAPVDAPVDEPVDARVDGAGDVPTSDVFLPSLRFRALSLGARHTCGITLAGELYCWGDNADGQLGDGTTNDRLIATRVALSAEVVEVAAGRAHTCARTLANAMYCWGNNSDGQLGDTTLMPRLSPVGVRDLDRNVLRIAVGSDHSCAMLTDRSVRCWGNNDDGQLGDGSTRTRAQQAYVAYIYNATTVISGARHACAMVSERVYCGATSRDAQVLRCWGANDHGQIGDGSYMPRRLAVPVTMLNTSCTTVEVPSAGGDHTCARSGASLYCWGANDHGQLGTGATSDETEPVAVFEVGVFVANYTPSLGAEHSCVRRDDGAIRCCGSNDRGQLGTGDTDDRLNLTATASTRDAIASIYAGAEHTCGLTADGAVYCFGRNDSGQLGLGDTRDRSRPQRVTP